MEMERMIKAWINQSFAVKFEPEFIFGPSFGFRIKDMVFLP
jgi:predicted alpha/beta superfamily hydrolase